MVVCLRFQLVLQLQDPLPHLSVDFSQLLCVTLYVFNLHGLLLKSQPGTLILCSEPMNHRVDQREGPLSMTGKGLASKGVTLEFLLQSAH